ncbi:MAG: fibronectin type III domain-containing protein, partial [Methanomassiliicoccales archaeon]|nr:fibronectin type III domain-containing protein [Methanomassiliicoccales archaeon]
NNSQGDGPASSEVNSTLPIGPRAPDAPTGLTAMPGSGFVSLSWSAPENQGGSAVVGYMVYRTSVPGANPSTPIAILHDGQRYYIDASLVSGDYYYKVSAVNSAEGPRSNESNATVDGIPPGSPGTIVSLSLIEEGSAIRLSWQAPPEGASPIIRYLVYRSSDPFDPLLLNATSSTSYLDSDVVIGQTYHYWMVAENSQGQGPLSAMLTGTAHNVGPVNDLETVLVLGLAVLLAGAVGVAIWFRWRK